MTTTNDGSMRNVDREKRINEIPFQIMDLKKEKNRCENKRWLSVAIMLQNKIDKLEAEFHKLCASYTKEEVTNEKETKD